METYTWTCAGCGRRVPASVAVCRCGRAAAGVPRDATATAAPPIVDDDGRSLKWTSTQWIAVIVCALCAPGSLVPFVFTVSGGGDSLTGLSALFFIGFPALLIVEPAVAIATLVVTVRALIRKETGLAVGACWIALVVHTLAMWWVAGHVPVA